MLGHLPALAEEAAAKATATLQPEDEERLRPLLTAADAESILDSGGFGRVFSKPYSIASIGPASSAGADAWRKEYTGRGIGRRLYLLAATLHSSTRWRLQGGLSESAECLRTRPHGVDPYRWEAPCNWCTERAIA